MGWHDSRVSFSRAESLVGQDSLPPGGKALLVILDERVRALEQRLGQRLILRGVRDPDPLWRGRISWRPGYVLLEYRDATPGFFWHHDIIRELLDLVEQGGGTRC